MKQLITIVLLLTAVHGSAQTASDPVLSGAGQTIQNFPVSVEMNFTFGQPFGQLHGAPCVQLISGTPILSASTHNATESTLGMEAIIDCLSEYLNSVGIEDLNDSNAGEMHFDPIQNIIRLLGFENDIEATMFIIDLSGRVLQSSNVQNTEVSLDRNLIPKGMFIAAMMQNEQLILTRKFVLNQ